MKFGLHLPQVDLGDGFWSADRLRHVVGLAGQSGFSAIAVNDNLTFPAPWLDGPTLLSSALEASEPMKLASLVLPMLRGPLWTARYLTTLDLLSGGRVIGAVAAGSSDDALRVCGIPPDERWARFDDAVLELSGLLTSEPEERHGVSESSVSVVMAPRPEQRIPIWMASWGTKAGLRRVARHSDGWLASGYNLTPEMFTVRRRRLLSYIEDAGRDPSDFPTGVATMFVSMGLGETAARFLLRSTLGPLLHRDEDELRERLLVGPVDECVAKLAAYQAAGLDWVFLVPVGDPIAQIEIVRDAVIPALPTA